MMLVTEKSGRGRATSNRVLAMETSEWSPRSLDWPPEVDMILSAIEAGRGFDPSDRRGGSRQPYRTMAMLRLFSDLDDTDPWQLYTRDVDMRGVGFITRHRLPLGYGGIVRLTLADDRELQAHCTLLRCREAAPGWYEGALCFNRPQEIGYLG